MSEDIPPGKASESSTRAYERNRADLIRFYKELAANPNPIPERSLREGKEEVLSPARKSLEKELAGRDPADKAATIRLSISSFLLDRLDKILKASLEGGKAGSFSLYLALRSQVRELLGPDYYSKKTEDIISAYLDLEPLLAAASELCSLESPPLEDIVSEFKRRAR